MTELTSKDIFLQNSLAEQEKPEIYSLEEEFAKTKKNWDFKPHLVFFSFVIILLLTTVATANYLETKSKQVNIDITDFEDLRLKETLIAAKEKELELDRKTEELNTRSKELSAKTRELKRIRSNFNSEIEKTKERLQEESDLKNADKKALKRLQDREKKRLESLKGNFEEDYAKKQAEVISLQESVKKETDSRRMLEQDLETYRKALNKFIKSNKADGCIIDRRWKKLTLFFPKESRVKNEIIVDIFRANDQYIGKVKLTPGNNGLEVEIIDEVSREDIEPFDWFRLP